MRDADKDAGRRAWAARKGTVSFNRPICIQKAAICLFEQSFSLHVRLNDGLNRETFCDFYN